MTYSQQISLLSREPPGQSGNDNRPPRSMDAPPLPDFTRFTRASTLELAEAVLAQYKANARWMQAIISVMKERPEPPAQSPMKPGGSPAASSRAAVPACSPSPCVCCGYSPELVSFRGEGSSKRLRQPHFDAELDTDTARPSQPTQGTPTRQPLHGAYIKDNTSVTVGINPRNTT